MKSKAIIVFLILISTLTVVSAVDLNNLNLPENFEKVSDVNYNNKVTGEEISLVTVTSEDLNSDLINSTQLKERLHPTEKNNIYSFTYESNNMSGCVELIKVDENYYVVGISIDGNANETKIQEMTDTLTKFNELNNFTAIDPTTIIN